MPGGGNPPHYHTTYAEIFTALEGELNLILNHQTVVLKLANSYEVKAAQVHRFFNATSAPIRFRNEVRPGHTGFENSLRILSGLATEWLYDVKKGIPKHLSHLAVVGIMSDMRLPGVMRLTAPALKLTAAWARWRGIEKALITRYCQ